MSGLLHPLPGKLLTQHYGNLANHTEPAGFWDHTGHAPAPLYSRRFRYAKFVPSIAAQHFHPGTDWACPVGTVILAPESGTIVAQGIIATAGGHPDGELYSEIEIRPGTRLFVTHLSGWLHKTGDHIERGAPWCKSGNTGISTGPHAHVEVRYRNGTASSKDYNWYRWNPERLLVGGDLANEPWIKPL